MHSRNALSGGVAKPGDSPSRSAVVPFRAGAIETIGLGQMLVEPLQGLGEHLPLALARRGTISQPIRAPEKPLVKPGLGVARVDHESDESHSGPIDDAGRAAAVSCSPRPPPRRPPAPAPRHLPPPRG